MVDHSEPVMLEDSDERRLFQSRRAILASTLAAGGLAGCLGEGDSNVGTPASSATPTVDSSSDLQTVDTTGAGDAEFELAEDSYSITATGDAFAHNAEGYAGIYAADAFESGMSVTVTLDSQDNTREWARTGLKVASDITDAGGSTGDLILVVTPGHGVFLQWDGDGDGYVGQDGSAQAGETTYPITLKLERQDAEFTGYYSTDGGDSFTEIGTASLSEPPAAMDVGMVHTTGNDQRGTATFSGFDVGRIPTPTPVEAETEPVPLPEDADALDRIVFGNEPSEANHDFTPETSHLAEGRNGRIGRQISLNVPDAEPGETIGSCSFTMDCHTDEQVHLTVKTQQDSPDTAGVALFHGDEQVGYTVGKFDWGSINGTHIGRNSVVKGDWVYFTMLLPESLTEDTDSVDLRLVTYTRRPGAGPIVQRAYTHTDELFELPSDEEDTLGRDTGVPWGEGNDGDIDTAIATLTENVENAVEGAQGQEQFSATQAGHLARATTRDWIDTVDREAIYERVRDSIDRAVRRQHEAGGGVDGASEIGGWHNHGAWASGFVKLSDMFEERGDLEEPIPDHPEDITRGEAYADFWEAGWKWRQINRRGITNQILIVTQALVSMAQALEILAPNRAPSQEKVDEWIDQAIGIEPMRALPSEREGWPLADRSGDWKSGVFHQLSEAGLNREQRYSHGYSLHPALFIPKMAKDTGLERVKERVADYVEGMGWFRWLGADLEADRRRARIQNGWLGARGNTWPGLGKYFVWQSYGRAPAALDVLGSDAEIAKRWAEVMIEDGTEFNTYEGASERLYHMMHLCDGLRKLKDMEPSTYELPSERDRAVFGDPDQGMVSITDGDVRIQACLGMGHGRHQSNIVRFDYQGPNSHRGGTTQLRRREFPLDKTIERANGVVHWGRGLERWGLSEPYLPWRGEHASVDQYLARDDVPEREVPIAGRPEGGSWPSGSYHTGFTYFYREAQIGPYRIGINPTGDDQGEQRGFGSGQSFTMEVPENAIDVATGEPIEADFVNVGPRETRVVKLP